MGKEVQSSDRPFRGLQPRNETVRIGSEEGRDVEDGNTLYTLLRQAQQAIDRLIAAKIHRSDLTPRQAELLLAIERWPASTPTHFSKVLNMEKVTIADVIRRLAQRELITYTRHPEDTRAKVVTLTAEGRKLARTARRILQAVEAEAVLAASRARNFPDKLAAIAGMTPRHGS
jgi:DNA-binding MarR family transcriptional regulator